MQRWASSAALSKSERRVMTDLEKLIPQDTLVQVAGETIAISPLKVGQLPAFLRVIAPVMAQLSQPQINWLALFGERGDDLLNAIGIAVKRPREWVDDLAADDALLLAAKVMEVNADFFTRTVIPKLDGLFSLGQGIRAANTGSTSPSV
jgi:hypothetical protein